MYFEPFFVPLSIIFYSGFIAGAALISFVWWMS